MKISKTDRRLYVLAGTLFLVPHILVGCMDAATVERARAHNAQLLDKPIISAIQSDSRGEDPDEDSKITAALVEQGYFSEDVPLSFELQDVLHTACGRHGVDYTLALGLIEVESGFDPDAIGPDGCDIGLFQLRLSNHTWLMGETGADPITPEGNIECGVWMLAYLLGQYNSLDEALTAYRYGHDSGDRLYAQKVLNTAGKWEAR